jgi:hypothetical protein
MSLIDAIRNMQEKPLAEQESEKPENDSEYNDEGGMALSQLKTAQSAVSELMKMIEKDDNLPEWVQSKLTKAVDYMDSVRDYLSSEKTEEVVKESKMGDMFLDMQMDAQEMSERDFIKKYNNQAGMNARELKRMHRQFNEEVNEALKHKYVLVDTSKDEVVASASDEKGVKDSMHSRKNKSNLKIVKLKRPKGDSMAGKLLGEPLKSWGEEVEVKEDMDKKFEEMNATEESITEEQEQIDEAVIVPTTLSFEETLKQVLMGEMKCKTKKEEKEEDEEGELDPVNKKAVKKKFADRKDKDIDNDGDVDASDKYIHKKRKAISKAMKKDNSDNSEDEYKEVGKSGKQTKVDTKPNLDEAEMSDAEEKKREEIVKSMKDKEQYFKDKYGDRYKEVMYATATKMAKKLA